MVVPQTGEAHLCRVEDERADVSMRLALDLLDGLGRSDAGDDNVSLLLEIEDERKAEGRISSKDDWTDRRSVYVQMQHSGFVNQSRRNRLRIEKDRSQRYGLSHDRHTATCTGEKTRHIHRAETPLILRAQPAQGFLTI